MFVEAFEVGRVVAPRLLEEKLEEGRLEQFGFQGVNAGLQQSVVMPEVSFQGTDTNLGRIRFELLKRTALLTFGDFQDVVKRRPQIIRECCVKGFKKRGMGFGADTDDKALEYSRSRQEDSPPQ